MGITNHPGITIGKDGLPPGGSPGQVVTKIGSEDYDANWQSLSSSSISDFNEAAQDAVGAMVDSTLNYVDATPLLQVNQANNFAWTGNNTQTAGDYTFSDNIKLKFGTNAEIYRDGTFLTLNGAITGTTAVSIGPINVSNGGTGRLVVNYIGLGGTPINTQFWINFLQTTNLGRGALQFDYTYTGSGPSLNVLSKLTYQGTATSITALSAWIQSYLGADTSGSGTTVGTRSTAGFFSTTAITAGGTKRMHGLHAQWLGDGGTHTNGNILWYGVEIDTQPNLTLSGATYTGWGINSIADIQIYDDVKMIYGGSNTTKGDSYDIYNSGTTDVDRYVNAVKTMTWDDDAIDCFLDFRPADGVNIVLGTTTGTKIGTSTTELLGFWGATPVAQPAAYTPTNVTADRSFDADSITLDELADVVGTLIQDLQSFGAVG